ncbi:P-loop NTPase fold protein [Sulfurisoma sediminicola]|uniref:KAP-like P-loop domain-containing protein n=1 Tax=Sulfurisoma sediminicola TaxID=1381557 RepID=A0A497XDL3_9PROT|nr:P-loop NTPase fold protein [Sulfurisoma sediminicola]RLJ64756.1 KAP-like P-loop domain-containing protein [Sulfurisoma sediminicola]
MSIHQSKQAIHDFLASDEPEVLALTGDWGVGKTFLWTQAVLRLKTQVSADKKFRYAYVSLFGVKDLESLKLAIFENIDDATLGETSPEGASGWGFRKLIGGGRKATKAVSQAPIVKNYTGSLVQDIAFSRVRNLVICIDDFERRSPSLLTREVLGLVSYLKEHRGCKIALIFNHGELDGQDDYDLYKEKVVDREIRLDPKPEEAIEVAIPRSDELAADLKTHATKLGLRNIRVLRKIDKLAVATAAILSGLHPTIRKQAVASLVLMGWCHYCPGKGPTLAFLKELTNRFAGWSKYLDDKSEDTQERQWEELLGEYGYQHTDALDLALMTTIERGYPDVEAIRNAANELDAQLKIHDGSERLTAAWHLFKHGFDDNQEEILAALLSAIQDHLKWSSVGEINSVVSLLRDFSRDDLADKLIDDFVAANSDRRERFDLSQRFPGDLYDSVLEGRLNAEHARLSKPKPLADALNTLGSNDGWSKSDEEAVLAASEDDLYDLVTKTHGADLPRYIRACLSFRRISNADEGQRKIIEKMENVLRRVGASSRLNRLRVERLYGVKLATEPKL